MGAVTHPSTYEGDYWISVNAAGHTSSHSPGKWLVFVYIEDVDRYWDLISQAVLSGKLGPSAKVATAKPNPNATNPRARLICVYTVDWHDRDDVRRVLRELRSMGIYWPLSYKTDEATTSGKYGSGASIYTSPRNSDDFHDRT